MQTLFNDMASYLLGNLVHNAPFLLAGILIAAIIKVHVKPERVKAAMEKRPHLSVPASVAFGAFTPLCACGTMAVIISMLTVSMPLAPIMSFLVSSPLMSPDGFVMIAGIIGLEFAIALTLSSILIGLGSGYATHLIETHTRFLSNQARFVDERKALSCGCAADTQSREAPCCDPGALAPEPALAGANLLSYTRECTSCSKAYADNETNNDISQGRCGCSGNTGSEHAPGSSINPEMSVIPAGCVTCGETRIRTARRKKNRFNLPFKVEWKALAEEIVNVGLKRVLFFYIVFVVIGFLVNRLVPASIVTALFNSQNPFAVPISALIGLPLYVGGESAIPLIDSLVKSGASGGAMLAFLITGPGTSAGVIAGITTILKARAVVLYVLFLLIGGIIAGYSFDMLISFGI